LNQELEQELSKFQFGDMLDLAENITDMSVTCTPTGFPQLDIALHQTLKGMPHGRDIEIFSKEPEVGKNLWSSDSPTLAEFCYRTRQCWRSEDQRCLAHFRFFGKYFDVTSMRHPLQRLMQCNIQLGKTGRSTSDGHVSDILCQVQHVSKLKLGQLLLQFLIQVNLLIFLTMLCLSFASAMISAKSCAFIV